MFMACPMCLSEDPPRMYSHTSNGVIVALVPSESPSVVYARCTDCRVVSDTTNPHVERLLRSDEKPSCWMKLSKEGVEALMEDMEEAGERGVYAHDTVVYTSLYNVCVHIPRHNICASCAILFIASSVLR